MNMDTQSYISKNGVSTEPMLVRLLPEQVSEKWEFFGRVLSMSLPPILVRDFRTMTNILNSILIGRLVVWAFSDGADLKAVLSTHLWREEVSGTMDLMIYSFTALKHLNLPSDWNTIIKGIGDYAKSYNCYTILACVENPKIIKFLDNQGADTTQTLVHIEVDL